MRINFGIRESALVLFLLIVGLLLFFRYEARQYYRQLEQSAPKHDYSFCCRTVTS